MPRGTVAPASAPRSSQASHVTAVKDAVEKPWKSTCNNASLWASLSVSTSHRAPDRGKRSRSATIRRSCTVIHTHKTRTDCNVVYDRYTFRYTRGSGADGGARPAPRGVVPGDRISAGGATIKPPSCSLTWNIPCHHHDCIHTTSPGEVQLSTHQESIRAEKGGDRLLATGIMFARFQRAAGPRTARPTCARVHDATRRGRRLRRRWRAGSAPFPSWCTIAWLALSDGGYTGDALEP